MATRKLSAELPNLTSPTFTATVVMPGFRLGSVTITATGTEINYLSGVTSNIQTQLTAKLASASYTAADVLAKILTVDGAGSGLDADTLDGAQGALYARLASPTFTGSVTMPGTGIWNSSGNVGVGTLSPVQKLHVVGTIIATGDIIAYYA